MTPSPIESHTFVGLLTQYSLLPKLFPPSLKLYLQFGSPASGKALYPRLKSAGQKEPSKVEASADRVTYVEEGWMCVTNATQYVAKRTSRICKKTLSRNA